MQDGKAIKMLATASRLDIEDFLQKKAYLEVIASLRVVALNLSSPCAITFEKFLIAAHDPLYR